MNLVTVMNFVRGVEPRNPELDLLEPVLNQIALNKKYGFDNTFLLQYDSLINPKFTDVLGAEKNEKTELGVWIEIVRPLVESVGIEWRGRPGFDWDWYVDPGFLPAYTLSEKKKLIDELMRKFKEVFGEYPKSAGSWLLDIDSVKYMSEKYGVEFFGICREQLAVDAYTLWGGPYNQPYYPSKNNILCPAQTKENQVNAPVFRLLGIDPIRGYNERRYAHGCDFKGCATMEPVWGYGQSKKCMEWFFRTYFDNENMGISYTQIGQENSFGWGKMKDGLEMQYELLKKYSDEGKISIVKTSDAARMFAGEFETTPAAAIRASEDPDKSEKYKSFWYTNKNYRANLFFDGKTMYFRDIQKYDEKYTERYLDEPCREWKAAYDALPVCDERVWSFENNSRDAFLEFKDGYTFERTERDGQKLTVYAKRDGGGETAVTFGEDEISISGRTELDWKFGKFKGYAAANGGIEFENNGVKYTVGVVAEFEETADGIKLSGDNIKFELAK